MNRRHLHILSAVLCLAGGAVFLFKAAVLGVPTAPDATSELWRLDVRIAFEAGGGPVKASVHIPRSEAGHTVIDQNFISQGYGLTTTPDGANQRAIFAIREALGDQTLYYRAVVVRTPAGPPTEQPQPGSVRPKVQKVGLAGLELEAARSAAKQLLRQSADEESLIKLLLSRLNHPDPKGEIDLLLGKDPTPQRKARIAASLLSLAQVPAREVHGIRLSADRRLAHFVHWLEIFSVDRWQAFDLADGRAEPPHDAIAWWRGGAPFARLEGGDGLDVDISVTRAFEVSLTAALDKGRELDSTLIGFSLFALPAQTRAVYQVMLTIPIGIFLLVVLRNVVGIKTFGTFMPVLIALAFRQTGLMWGLLLFASVVAAGLAVRFYLERLKLLLVPRIAAVVITVILLMAVYSVLSFKLGFEQGLSVALFPIVILAMTIERMSVVWDERGPAEAFQQAGGSLLVAAICYGIMNLPLVQHLAFVFPELLLVVLAGVLLIGRYTGYRLVELRRFRALADDR